MDWSGIATAYLDRERARLGLPSREALAMKRAAEERAAAESASQLQTQGVQREYDRARIEALPEEQAQIRRLREAQIANYAEPNRGEPAAQTETQILANGNIGVVNRTTGKVVDTGVKAQVKPAAGGGEGGGLGGPKTGWKEIYGPDGKLVGFTHPAAGFRTPEQLGMPSGSRVGAPTAGERDALALGNVPIRAGDTMGKALDATLEAEKKNPLDPSTWTGPIAGRVGAAYRGVVDSSGPAGDFEQARREARALVYALSGKQINQQEQQWLDQIVPRLSDRGAKQQLERYDRFVNYLRLAKQQGYSDPFAVAQAQIDRELPSAGAAPGAAPATPAAGPAAPVAPPAAGGQRIINGVPYQRGTGPDGRPGWVRVRQ